MVLGKLDIHMHKKRERQRGREREREKRKEIEPLIYTIYKNKFKMD